MEGEWQGKRLGSWLVLEREHGNFSICGFSSGKGAAPRDLWVFVCIYSSKKEILADTAVGNRSIAKSELQAYVSVLPCSDVVS